MWKKYVLYCMVDSIDESEVEFYFDTKEQMFDFILNGDEYEGVKPGSVKVAAMFEMKRVWNSEYTEWRRKRD